MNKTINQQTLQEKHQILIKKISKIIKKKINSKVKFFVKAFKILLPN